MENEIKQKNCKIDIWNYVLFSNLLKIELSTLKLLVSLKIYNESIYNELKERCK